MKWIIFWLAKYAFGQCPSVIYWGHHHWKWNICDIRYCKIKLSRVQKHLFHPIACTLYNPRACAKPGEAKSKTKNLIEDIFKARWNCQWLFPKPRYFKLFVPGKIVFNYEVALDLMFLWQNAFLARCRLTHTFQSSIIHKRAKRWWSLERNCHVLGRHTHWISRMCKSRKGSQFTTKKGWIYPQWIW